MPYNLVSCGGWGSGSGYVGSMPCISARVGLVILFFLIAIIRKWGGEEMGLEFSFVLALAGGLVPYLVIVTIFGSFKVALGIGIVGALIGGYGGGILFGGGGEY